MKRFIVPIYITLALSQFACQISKKPTTPVKVVQKSVSKQTDDDFALPQAPTPIIVSASFEEAKPEPVAITVGANALKTSDLALEVEKRMLDDSISPKNALEDVIYDQRIIADAKKRGYDQTEDFKGEMETYRGIFPRFAASRRGR